MHLIIIPEEVRVCVALQCYQEKKSVKILHLGFGLCIAFDYISTAIPRSFWKYFSFETTHCFSPSNSRWSLIKLKSLKTSVNNSILSMGSLRKNLDDQASSHFAHLYLWSSSMPPPSTSTRHPPSSCSILSSTAAAPPLTFVSNIMVQFWQSIAQIWWSHRHVPINVWYE